MASANLVILYFMAVSFLASSILVWLSIRVASRLGFLDHPVGGRQHRESMPNLGGVAMFSALALVIGAHALLVLYGREYLPEWITSRFPSPRPEAWQRLLAIACGSFFIVVIGVIDDVKQTPIWLRLGLELVAAIILVSMGVQPTLAHLPEIVVFILTVLWIVGITNAFNFLDGLDGLAATMAFVAAAVFMVFMLITGQEVVSVLLAALCGVTLGFLRYNWYPARTYMGSAGSLLLGFLLASIPLVSDFMHAGSSSLAPLFLPVLVLSVPLYDSASVILLRARHTRSLFKSDLNHLGHRLLRLGLTVPQAVGAMALLGTATGLMSLLLLDADTLKALLILLAVGAMFAVFVLLEQVHLSYHDAKRLVDVAARCLINDGKRAPNASPTHAARARLLSCERIELVAGAEAMPFFAEALGKNHTASIELSMPGGEAPLTLLVSIRSLWCTEENRIFIGLTPIFSDDAQQQRARQWIGKATYPGREVSIG